jgi:hypothetical protein
MAKTSSTQADALRLHPFAHLSSNFTVSCSCLTVRNVASVDVVVRTESVGSPIILGRCPSLSAHESESMLRTYHVWRERETSKQHVGESHSVLITAILLPQRLSCYWGKTVSLRMLISLRLATAQQRTTGQDLPSHLYRLHHFSPLELG